MPDSIGQWTFRKQVNEVTVMFTAKYKGKFVSALQPGDVQVWDDKRPVTIVDLHDEENLPLRLGLLVDISGSVASQFHVEQEAASRFLDAVMDHPQDQAFIMGFSHRSRVIQDFTHNRGQLRQSMRDLHPDEGNTAVFDAIVSACRRLAAKQDEQPVARVLVLLSDGEDNASQFVNLKQAVRVAQAAEVTVYTIGAAGLDVPGADVLRRIAKESGGRAFLATKPKQGMSRAFAKISEELRRRYAVSYRPAPFDPNGHFRTVRIVARKHGKDLHVHARKGYFASLHLVGFGVATSVPFGR